MHIDSYRSRCSCYARGLDDHACELKDQAMTAYNFNARDVRTYCKYCDDYHRPCSQENYK